MNEPTACRRIFWLWRSRDAAALCARYRRGDRNGRRRSQRGDKYRAYRLIRPRLGGRHSAALDISPHFDRKHRGVSSSAKGVLQKWRDRRHARRSHLPIIERNRFSNQPIGRPILAQGTISGFGECHQHLSRCSLSGLRDDWGGGAVDHAAICDEALRDSGAFFPGIVRLRRRYLAATRA